MLRHLCLLVGLMLGVPVPPAPAATPAAAPAPQAIRVDQAWARPTPPGAPVAAGYLRITNTGAQSDRLLRITSPLSQRVEMHSVSHDGGVMRMRKLAEGVVLEPGATLEFKPGANHLMFFAPTQPLAVGQAFDGVLVFERGGEIPLRFQVRTSAD